MLHPASPVERQGKGKFCVTHPATLINSTLITDPEGQCYCSSACWVPGEEPPALLSIRLLKSCQGICNLGNQEDIHTGREKPHPLHQEGSPGQGQDTTRGLRRVYSPCCFCGAAHTRKHVILWVTDTLRAQLLPLLLRSCCKKYSHVLGMST